MLVLFIVYSTLRAFENANYFAAPVHLAVLLAVHHDARARASTFPELFPGPSFISPALYILVVPLGFRLTCYYYRKAYYRSFWLSPPACAVAEPHATYTGETRFPLVFQNVHRYFFYLGLVFNVILTYDAVLGVPRRATSEWFHMGLGTLVLLVNAVLLWLYSLSCHSCRHIVGGRLKHFSAHPVRYRAWTLRVAAQRAGTCSYAWVSLVGVALHRPLRPPARHRHDHRPEVLLTWGPMTELERHAYDVVVVGAGGAGLRAAIEAHEQGARTAVVCKSPARQGAHGHGRGRHRRGDGQRLPRGQLAGALPRHHARRQDAQPLADGAAARAGGARPGARARGLGRAVRPHARRADLASATSAATATPGSRTSATAPGSS